LDFIVYQITAYVAEIFCVLCIVFKAPEMASETVEEKREYIPHVLNGKAPKLGQSPSLGF